MPSLFKSSQGIDRLVMEEVNNTLVAYFKRKIGLAWSNIQTKFRIRIVGRKIFLAKTLYMNS